MNNQYFKRALSLSELSNTIDMEFDHKSDEYRELKGAVREAQFNNLFAAMAALK